MMLDPCTRPLGEEAMHDLPPRLDKLLGLLLLLEGDGRGLEGSGRLECFLSSLAPDA